MIVCTFEGVLFDVATIPPELNRNMLSFSANAGVKQFVIKDESQSAFAAEINRQNPGIMLEFDTDAQGVMVVRLRPLRAVNPAVAPEFVELENDEPEDGLEVEPEFDGGATQQPEPNLADRPQQAQVQESPAGMVAGLPELADTGVVDVAAAAAALSPQIAKFVQESRVLAEKVEELNRRMVAAAQLKREITAMMADIEGRHPNVAKINASVVELKKKPYVESVFVNDKHVVVTTTALQTENEIKGSRREIGRMQIEIAIIPLLVSSAPSGGFLSIRNLDRRWCDAPNSYYECGHVHNTKPCLGEYWEEIYDAIQRSDVELFVEIVIRFIKNPHIGDCWGCKILRFPSVGSEVAQPVVTGIGGGAVGSTGLATMAEPTAAVVR